MFYLHSVAGNQYIGQTNALMLYVQPHAIWRGSM